MSPATLSIVYGSLEAENLTRKARQDVDANQDEAPAEKRARAEPAENDEMADGGHETDDGWSEPRLPEVESDESSAELLHEPEMLGEDDGGLLFEVA